MCYPPESSGYQRRAKGGHWASPKHILSLSVLMSSKARRLDPLEMSCSLKFFPIKAKKSHTSKTYFWKVP